MPSRPEVELHALAVAPKLGGQPRVGGTERILRPDVDPDRHPPVGGAGPGSADHVVVREILGVVEGTRRGPSVPGSSPLKHSRNNRPPGSTTCFYSR